MPLKSYLDMVVSSWQGRLPPRPDACSHPAAKISLLHPPSQAPGGAETKPAATPRQAGTRSRDLGDGTAAPGTSSPRGSWKGRGDGAETPGEGDGDGDRTGALVAQRVPACGRCSEAGTPPEPPLPVRCSGPGTNGGRRVSASSGSAGPGWEWEWEGRGEASEGATISPAKAGVSHSSGHQLIPS